MESLRLKTIGCCMLAMGALTAVSCSGNDKEDQNATIVNVEKDVASPVNTSDNAGHPEDVTASVEPAMTDATAEKAVEEMVEAPEQAQDENAGKETEMGKAVKEKKAPDA